MQEGKQFPYWESRTQLFRVTNCGDQDVIPGSNWSRHPSMARGPTQKRQWEQFLVGYSIRAVGFGCLTPWQLLLPPLANHSCAPPPQCSLSSESTKQVDVAITGTLDPRQRRSNSYQDHSVVNTLEVKLERNKGQKKEVQPLFLSYNLSFDLLIYRYNTIICIRFYTVKEHELVWSEMNCDLSKKDFTHRAAKRVALAHVQTSQGLDWIVPRIRNSMALPQEQLHLLEFLPLCFQASLLNNCTPICFFIILILKFCINLIVKQPPERCGFGVTPSITWSMKSVNNKKRYTSWCNKFKETS